MCAKILKKLILSLLYEKKLRQPHQNINLLYIKMNQIFVFVKVFCSAEFKILFN